MTILYCLMDFREIAGAQMHYYELAKAMQKRGHTCKILSNIGGIMKVAAEKEGIQVLPYKHLGDFTRHDADVIHASHIPVVNDVLQREVFENKPFIQTCHSEIIPVEFPVIHHKIKRYIAIRPTIYSIIKNAGIPTEKIELIYNPIDESIFRRSDRPKKQFILFVGSVDYLRINVVREAIKEARSKNMDLVVIGRNDFPGIFSEYKRIRFLVPTLQVSSFFQDAQVVYGIQAGRTGAEALLCGTAYKDYEVDEQGNIKKSTLYNPDPETVEQVAGMYRSSLVAERMEGVYLETISN